MQGCKQCQEFHDAWLRADNRYTEAVRLLWLFDDNPRVQEYFKKCGFWKTSDTKESANTSTNNTSTPCRFFSREKVQTGPDHYHEVPWCNHTPSQRTS